MEEFIVDLHAHILPGVDDGAKNWEESEAMLDLAIAQGIRVIIATPHYSRHLDTKKIRELVGRLEQEAKTRCADFCIYPGQEILYFDSLVEALKEGTALTLADSRYVLLEFSPELTYQKIYQGVCKLLRGGYYPILAHIERYPVLRDEGNLEELAEIGCLFQINYSSLWGSILNSKVRWCRKQIIQNRIHVLGTDMHGENWRPPHIEGSLKWLTQHTKPEVYREITQGMGMKVIRYGKAEK